MSDVDTVAQSVTGCRESRLRNQSSPLLAALLGVVHQASVMCTGRLGFFLTEQSTHPQATMSGCTTQMYTGMSVCLGTKYGCTIPRYTGMSVCLGTKY